MKKRTVISCGVILAITAIFFLLSFLMGEPKYTGEFSARDFQEEMDNIHFQTDKNYGKITDYKSAAEAGKSAAAERFGHDGGSIPPWMGCHVQYDSEEDVYMIRIFPYLMTGGEYAVMIRSDGAVLAIWGMK